MVMITEMTIGPALDGGATVTTMAPTASAEFVQPTSAEMRKLEALVYRLRPRLGLHNDRDFQTMDHIPEPWPFAQARADAIVAAQKEWDRQCYEMQERLGLFKLGKRMDDANEEMRRVKDAICEAHPKSAAGLWMKAKPVLEDDEWLDEDGILDKRIGKIAFSILRAVAT